MRRLPGFRGALVPAHPQFAPDSPAALTETGPVPLDAPKVVYSKADDEAIEANIRNFGWLILICHSPLTGGANLNLCSGDDVAFGMFSIAAWQWVCS